MGVTELKANVDKRFDSRTVGWHVVSIAPGSDIAASPGRQSQLANPYRRTRGRPVGQLSTVPQGIPSGTVMGRAACGLAVSSVGVPVLGRPTLWRFGEWNSRASRVQPGWAVADGSERARCRPAGMRCQGRVDGFGTRAE